MQPAKFCAIVATLLLGGCGANSEEGALEASENQALYACYSAYDTPLVRSGTMYSFDIKEAPEIHYVDRGIRVTLDPSYKTKVCLVKEGTYEVLEKL